MLLFYEVEYPAEVFPLLRMSEPIRLSVTLSGSDAIFDQRKLDRLNPFLFARNVPQKIDLIKSNIYRFFSS